MQSFYFYAYFQEKWKYVSKEHTGRPAHEQQSQIGHNPDVYQQEMREIGVSILIKGKIT